MFNQIEYIKNMLDNSINQLCQSSRLCGKDPSKDFTRNRKLPLDKIIRLLLGMEGSSMNNEVIRFFNYSPDFASASALIQQRSKISDSVFPSLFSSFVEKTDTPKFFKGYRLIAVDGSDIHIPPNPTEPDTYFVSSYGQKAFSLLHLDVLYDLKQRTYLDAYVSKRRNWNEAARLCDMVDRSNVSNAIIIADRGYESYNVMAHIHEKGLKFLIRIKDINSTGIASGLDLPRTEEFDVPIRLRLMNRRTKEAVQLAESRNEFKLLTSQYRFDFLPDSYSRNDPLSFYELSFRVVRIKISDDSYELLVTNLDSKAFSPCQLKALYSMRWGIETSFRELKYTVGLLHFHSKKVEFIIQEIFARLIMYNFSELITSHVVIQKSNRKHPCKVNFSVAVQVCRQFFRGNVSPPDVEAVLARNISAIRNARAFPRNLTSKAAVSFLYRVA